MVGRGLLKGLPGRLSLSVDERRNGYLDGFGRAEFYKVAESVGKNREKMPNRDREYGSPCKFV